MADSREIAVKLTANERFAVLDCGEEYAKFTKARGILTVNAIRNRHKLIEAEDAERGIWNYRLTPLGRAVKDALKEMAYG